ncbi:MAG TPA: zf-HC2 domain-containing protein, partial [Thermoanaerobaculia bacterium]|nr:zf-HC2 domain-containing protein [Thermoanaerobaculia bacterium]
MTDWHADRDMIERFLHEELPEEQSRFLERHLMTCSGCEELLIEALPARPAAGQLHGEAYRLLVRRALREMRTEGEQIRVRLAGERSQAGQLWQEMHGLSAAARRERVWEDPRFQSWGFFELLVDKARWVVLEEPRQAEEILRLALDVTEHLEAETYGKGSVESAKARAWASLGNALRVLADFRQAELAFSEAESHLENGWHDPLDEALLLEYKASLRRAQRRFGEALELLN